MNYASTKKRINCCLGMTSEDFYHLGAEKPWWETSQLLRKLKQKNVITEEETVPPCWPHTVMATIGLNSELKEMNRGEWTLKQTSSKAGMWRRRSGQCPESAHSHLSIFASLTHYLFHTTCSTLLVWANPSVKLLNPLGNKVKCTQHSTHQKKRFTSLPPLNGEIPCS